MTVETCYQSLDHLFCCDIHFVTDFLGKIPNTLTVFLGNCDELSVLSPVVNHLITFVGGVNAHSQHWLKFLNFYIDVEAWPSGQDASTVIGSKCSR